MNPNYIKGRNKEYDLKHQLEREGYTVLRTAGSHGFADLIAVSSLGKIRFIQCKPDDFSEKEKEKLMKENGIFNDKRFRWTVSFEVI